MANDVCAALYRQVTYWLKSFPDQAFLQNTRIAPLNNCCPLQRKIMRVQILLSGKSAAQSCERRPNIFKVPCQQVRTDLSMGRNGLTMRISEDFVDSREVKSSLSGNLKGNFAFPLGLQI